MMTETEMQIANNIHRLRKQSKLKQHEVASKLQLMGFNITRGTWSKIECGARTIRSDELYAISIVLKVSLDEIFTDITY